MHRARNLGQPVSLKVFEASLLPRGGRRPGLQWTPRTRTGLRAAIVLSWNLAFWNDVRRCGGTGRTRHPGCRLIATSGIFAQTNVWSPEISNRRTCKAALSLKRHRAPRQRYHCFVLTVSERIEGRSELMAAMELIALLRLNPPQTAICGGLRCAFRCLHSFWCL